jgi:L-aspartate oxidase
VGAHSRSRVLHAHGDSTGREISRTLYRKAASLGRVSFRSFVTVIDLLTADGAVIGATVLDEHSSRTDDIFARAVLLATGGLGRVFQETTNPGVATGDGVAIAYRAGAEIADIEFVQFHPTVLHLEGAPRFLLSEALRGEGAVLRNVRGERFMDRYHQMAELAPRDVVSRAIVREMAATRAAHVLLDMTHRDTAFLRRRFPRIYETCLAHGVDLARQPAPVHPAAHYAMGGVRTDLRGRTRLARLYAAGEAACTGVHGANRLASNSLLDGLVFGARAGAVMRDEPALRPTGAARPTEPMYRAIAEHNLRELMWAQCGIIRSGQGLEEALAILREPASEKRAGERANHELRNMHLVARLIAECAWLRRESRGAHYRTDFPEPLPDFQRHSVIDVGRGPVLESW